MRIIMILFLLTDFFFGTMPAAADSLVASWYGPGFAGHRMADGAVFRPEDPTIAAHRTLPFGTRLRLTNPATGASLVVVVRDRGPYVRGRSLDLSRAGARALGYERAGTATLEVDYLDDAPVLVPSVPLSLEFSPPALGAAEPLTS